MKLEFSNYDPLSGEGEFHESIEVFRSADHFRWLKDQPEGAAITSDVIDCLKATAAIENAARLPVEKNVLKVDQIRKIILVMPAETFWQRRDRAILAFLLLSGMRVTAILKLRLRHIDTAEGRIRQDPAQIDTKGDKAKWTLYFPVGSDIAEIIREWIDEVEANATNEDAYIFPKTPNQRKQTSTTVFLEHWATADPIRKIIRTAASTVGVSYFNPRSIRSSLAQLRDELPMTARQKRAFSRNFGHEQPRTTGSYYAKLDNETRHKEMRDLFERNVTEDETCELLRKYSQLTPRKRKWIQESLDNALDPAG